MDFKSIYSVACTINRAETLKARNIQDETLRDLIKKALKNDQAKLISEAIEECNIHNKDNERNLITNHYVDLVTTLYTNEGMINARTDLILLPVIMKSDKETGKMLKLSEVEILLEKGLKDNFFIPPTSNIHLYSVFFNREKVENMDLAAWYKLHSKMVFSREKSMQQNIYLKNFGVTLKPKKDELFYFVALVYQNRKLVESIEPDLFDRRQMNLDDKKKFLSYINEEFKKFSSSTLYEVLMPDNIFKTVDEARFNYQDKMIHYFIGRKTKIPNTEFFIASLEESICLFAYNKDTHKVYDKMKLYPHGGHSHQENIDNIFDALADNKTYVYIAKENQTEEFYEESDTFNLEDFLDKHEYEKFMPNYNDSSDFYL